VSLKRIGRKWSGRASQEICYKYLLGIFTSYPVENDVLYTGVDMMMMDIWIFVVFHTYIVFVKIGKSFFTSIAGIKYSIFRLLTLFKVNNDTSIAIIGTSVKNWNCHTCQGLLSVALYIVQNKQLVYFSTKSVNNNRGFETDPIIVL